jgi:hypothetical protein
MTMGCKCKRDRRRNSREDGIIGKNETGTEMQQQALGIYFNVKKRDERKGTQ